MRRVAEAVAGSSQEPKRKKMESFHTWIALILATLSFRLATVQAQRRPPVYVRASDADAQPNSRVLSFANSGPSFSSDRQQDIGSPSSAAAANLEESAKAVLNQGPAPAAAPSGAAAPKDPFGSASDKDGPEGKPNPLPTQQPNDLPTFVPATLPLNNPKLLPVHVNDGPADSATIPPLPPGYTEAPEGDGFRDSNIARDAPRRGVGNVSPSEVCAMFDSSQKKMTNHVVASCFQIKDGQSLALYMLANQYRQQQEKEAAAAREAGGTR